MNSSGKYTVWCICFTIGFISVSPVLAESVPPMNVPYFAQNVAPWSTQYIGNNSYFIGNAGCALTSTAMVFSYYGIDLDPSGLNAWLTINNGYDAGGNIIWKTAAEISDTNHEQTITLDQAKDVKSWATDLNSTTLADLAVINQYLRSGYPVLAKVWYPGINYAGGWHWVVLTGFSDSEGPTVYTIHDPFLDHSNIHGPRAMTIPDQVDMNGLVSTDWVNSTARTAPVPAVPPSGVTGLRNTTYQQTSITWAWTDPSSPGFDHVMVYLDGTLRANATRGNQTYTVSSLTPDTRYIIATRTVDTTGVVSPDWVNSTARTAPVLPVPPAGITGLHNTTYQQTSITWVWTDPSSADFDHVMVSLDGIFQANVTRGTQTWTASSLTPGSRHTIATHTAGTTGMVNLTRVNHTADTAPRQGIVFELDTGWNIFSTPILLEPSYSFLDTIFSPGSLSHIEIILGYDGMHWFTPGSSYSLAPLDALYVKVNGSATAIITPSSIVSPPPVRSLYPGISLIGSAPQYSSNEFLVMPVDQALISIDQISEEQTGQIQVISPGLNQPVWLYAKGGTVQDILPFKGYWVMIEHPDTLYGFSTTPIQHG